MPLAARAKRQPPARVVQPGQLDPQARLRHQRLHPLRPLDQAGGPAVEHVVQAPPPPGPSSLPNRSPMRIVCAGLPLTNSNTSGVKIGVISSSASVVTRPDYTTAPRSPPNSVVIMKGVYRH